MAAHDDESVVQIIFTELNENKSCKIWTTAIV